MIKIEVNKSGYTDLLLNLSAKAGATRIPMSKVNEIKNLVESGKPPAQIHEITGAALSTIWKVKGGFYDE